MLENTVEAKEQLDLKIQSLHTEICKSIRYAINYDELIDTYKEIEKIDFNELEWNNAKDERHFDNLQRILWIYRELRNTIDELEAVDDNKMAHRMKKEIENSITSIRMIRKESKEIIEGEQRVIDESGAAIDLLNEIRDS